MSYSSVRLAFVWSVAKTVGVRQAVNQVRVDRADERVAALRRRLASSGDSRSSHFSFEPEKYVSSFRPVLRGHGFVVPGRRSSWQIGSPRRHCQTIALCSGRPVCAVEDDERLALIGDGEADGVVQTRRLPADCRATTASTFCQISSASCSTQPGCG